jgi:putative aminopeptidase FrvX
MVPEKEMYIDTVASQEEVLEAGVALGDPVAHERFCPTNIRNTYLSKAFDDVLVRHWLFRLYENCTKAHLTRYMEQQR